MFLSFIFCGFQILAYVFAQDAMLLLVYIETRVTWMEARNICMAGDGVLVSVESPQKVRELSYLDSKPIWNYKIQKTQFWTGMYTDKEGIPCDSAEFIWQNGDPVVGTWTNWYPPNEPDACQTDYCIRLVKYMWRTRNCSIPYNLMCQYTKGQCDMEALYNMTLSNDTINMTVNKTLEVRGDPDYCTSLCLQSRLYGMRCWVVAITKSNARKCILYYNENEISRFDANNTSLDTDLYVRRCIDARVYTGDPYNPIASETTTMTTSEPGCPTTVTENPTTAMSTETSTSPDNVICYKQQFSNISSADLHEAVKKLRNQLHILKSETVLYKLRKISVFEKRSSAIGIGLISSLCLGALLVIMVIADLPKLSLQIKRHWFRKKKRTKIPTVT